MPEILFFPYFGPNRRSDRRVVEIRLDFETADENGIPQLVSDTRKLLEGAGILSKEEPFPDEPLPEQSLAAYSSLLAQIALLFQRKCDHRVGFFSIIDVPGKRRQFALVEYEHCDVGMTAVKLAVEIITGKRHSVSEPFKLFSEFAQQRKLPFETGAIIKAASGRGIPHFQLEQGALAGKFDTGFRVRPNGLLILGHGAANHVLDGTFCVDMAADNIKALHRNPGQRRALLENLGFEPAPYDDRAGSMLFHLLSINRQVIAVARMADDSMHVVDEVHPSFIDLTLAIGEETGHLPLSASLAATSLSEPLEVTGGAVLDFDLAPNLETLLMQCEGGQALLDQAASEMIDWLFPDPGNARMPIIAVTVTNGKTTTCRMISFILKHSGRNPGLVCSDGILLNGVQVSDSDACSFLGHARVLTSKLVDTAVLEAHHRGIAIRGFAYDSCNVAVCLNVTEEHLIEGEIETVEEMAQIKRALPERASDAAVIFVDDPHCISMRDFLSAEKICLVSLRLGADQLRSQFGDKAAYMCVLETIEGADWLVILDREKRLPVLPVKQVPATFDGAARFNVSNAMHAAAASYLAGTDIELIRAALSQFKAGTELTPGRMNVFDELPFKIIIDYAHTPDSVKKVCEFVDKQDVSGRKLIAFSGSTERVDLQNRHVASEIAGHFDFYFCKDYQGPDEVERGFVAPFMQQVLIEEGVPEAHTTVLTYGKEVIFSILDACEQGDLLVMLLGTIEKGSAPAYIREFAGR